MKLFILSLLIFITNSNTSWAQSQLKENYNEKVEELLNEYPINSGPGIAISVVQDGEIIYKKNKGYANLEHLVAITDSTKFVVGSIAKQFTAFSILLLEDEGKLSIGDNIIKYLPELDELGHNVTIKQLINHTSGFRNTTDLNSLKGITDQDLTSQEEMVRLLLRQKGLNFIPGSRFQYCNAAYVLLAEIVKRVSGMSFAEFTQERIFEPLKMENSLFVDDPNLLVKNKAFSYYKQDNSYCYIPLNRSIVGSTGLYTTVGDLCLWANNFDNRTVGSQNILQKMKEKSSLNNEEIIPYALGQELKMYKGLNVIFHGGGDAGFRSYLLRVPQHKLSIAISGNFESFNPLNLAYGLIDAFLPNEIKEPIKKKVPIYANKDLKKFEGDYQVFPGLYITILAEKDSLYFSPYGSDDKLILPVLGENEFTFPTEAHSKFRFYHGGLDWHFSDFYYPGKKVTINPPKYDSLTLNSYQGIYKSPEIKSSYEFIIKDDKLIATHNMNEDVILEPIENDIFISNWAYFSRVEFIRNSEGEIEGCKVSAQTSYDILFSKIECQF